MRQRKTHGKPLNQATRGREKYLVARIFLVILLITNLASFMVWQNIKGMELDRSIRNLEKEQLSLYKVYHEKLAEYERIRRTERVLKFAREKLGMSGTKRADFISLGIRNKAVLQEKYPGGKREVEK